MLITLIILLSAIGGLAVLANPFIGLLAIVALIPLSLIPALENILLVFSALTPIKIIGGIAFVGALGQQIMKGKQWDFMKEPVVLFYFWFLIYVFINGFAWPSSFTRENFTFYVSIAVLGFLVLTQINTEKRLHLIIWAVLVSALVVSINSIINYVGFQSVTARAAGGAFDPNYFAISLLPLIAISAYNFGVEKNKVLKVVSVVICLVFLGGLAVTQSRGGFVGLAGMLFIAFFTARKKFAALIIILVASVLIISFMPEHFWDRFAETKLEATTPEESQSATIGSTVRRYYLAKAAWEMFLKNPIFGVGLGNFYWECPLYYPLYPGRAHNMYLEILAEMGITGFILFMGMLVSFFRCLKRLGKAEFPYNLRAKSFFVGHMGFFIAALFLHAQQEKGFWLIMFMAVAMERMWKKKEVR
jgi:O-antigen ligase